MITKTKLAWTWKEIIGNIFDYPLVKDNFEEVEDFYGIDYMENRENSIKIYAHVFGLNQNESQKIFYITKGTLEIRFKSPKIMFDFDEKAYKRFKYVKKGNKIMRKKFFKEMNEKLIESYPELFV